MENKKVILDNGKDVVPYQKLILAPGGVPRRLPIEGVDLENVYTFRGIDDAKKVDAGKVSDLSPYCVVRTYLRFSAAQKGKRVVVIGSSFISMELVVAMSKRELASIDVIGMDEFPFQNVLGKEIGAGLKKVLFPLTQKADNRPSFLVS